MAITLLAPEYIFGRAVANLRSCIFHTPQLEELAHQDRVPWSKYHTCLADMGGFVLAFPRAAGEEVENNGDGSDEGDGEGGGDDKPPSLLSVSIAPLSPIDLGHGRPATPGHFGDNRLSSPGLRHSVGSFVDIEAGGATSPSSHPRLSRSSSTSSESTTTTSYVPSTTESAIATSHEPELSRHNRDKTAYHGKSTSRAFLSGKDWGEALIRRARHRYIERKTQLYGPILWTPHPELVAISKQIISSVTAATDDDNNSNSASRSTSTFPALPIGMNKHQLIRALVTLEGDNIPLCAAQLLEARRMGLIDRLPYMTEAMVCDRDKGDTLVKLVAVWQTSWLVIDLIVRQVSDLPSSPLEIMVLAFAALASMIYLINWFQPKDVQTPFYMYAVRLPTAEELHALATLTPKAHGLWPGIFANKHIPSVSAHSEGYYTATRIWGTGMVWSGMVFGSLHLAAWNCNFPTVVEKWIWRGSALVTTAWPSIPGVLGWVVAMLQRRLGDQGGKLASRMAIRRFWQAVALPLLIVPLFCARVFVLVEAYRSLYYLPPESYVTTWTSNVPRFG